MKNVLLINDDALAAKGLIETLRIPGLEISLASNGDIAQKLSELKNFDLIIADVRIPPYSGAEIVSKINGARDQAIPTIFTAGYSDEKHIEEALRLNPVGVLKIPFETTLLTETIEKVLQIPYSNGNGNGNGHLISPTHSVSQVKKFFYSALGTQWTPEREVDWSGKIGFPNELSPAMGDILTPIVTGEYSAFNGIPRRILSIDDYEVKQYLSVQLVDETRHAEAFDLYLDRIGAKATYKRSWRNIHLVRYFNEMKKLEDVDKWLMGLLTTEITAHVLLQAYIRQTNCKLTQHLFNRISLDEARHISFVNYYMKVVLRNSTESDRELLTQVVQRILRLTGNMLQHYEPALNAFDLNPKSLFVEIQSEIERRVAKNILRTDSWIPLAY